VASLQVILTVGSTGLDITLTIVLGDITSLQWRGMAQGIVASPYIVVSSGPEAASTAEQPDPL
jgi:hypothetical protein